MSVLDKHTWNKIIAGLPGAHILQTWEWGQVKKRFGWQTLPRVWHDHEGNVAAAALILTRVISLGRFSTPWRVMYIPRGPLLTDWSDAELREEVFSELRTLARKNNVIFIKIDPEVVIGRGESGVQDPAAGEIIADLKGAGWVFSPEQVQFRNTMIIELNRPLEELLAGMKQKTRYNVRLATRRGVQVRLGKTNDLDLLFQMYAETSLRDGFTIRNKNYYHVVWSEFIEAGMAEPLIAEVEGEEVAGVIIFRFAHRAWYLYGMSKRVHREKMPNYLLQWEAIKRAKEASYAVYDLWGAPDDFIEGDNLWGVYRFKQGLGAEVVRFIGAWDLPLNPVVYRLYTQMVPRLLALMRRRGKGQIQGSIQAG